jgi:hypothetical protein
VSLSLTCLEIQEALQHPERAFRDPELKQLRMRSNKLGLPLVYAGGCALTTRGRTALGKEVAIRCIFRPIQGLEARHTALAKLRPTLPDALSVSGTTSIHPNTLQVRGQAVTVTLLPWINGTSLDQAVRTRLHRPWALSRLLAKLHDLARELAKAGIAHGDIQHGNILLDHQGHLHLIDLDSIRLPGGPEIPPGFMGHPNYQHPHIPNHRQGAEADRFPFLVIHLTIQALILRPHLWKRFHTGENLLFSQKDLLDPHSSLLLHELLEIPHLKAQVTRFVSCCLDRSGSLPSLDDFLNGEQIHSRWLPRLPRIARSIRPPRLDARGLKRGANAIANALRAGLHLLNALIRRLRWSLQRFSWTLLKVVRVLRSTALPSLAALFWVGIAFGCINFIVGIGAWAFSKPKTTRAQEQIISVEDIRSLAQNGDPTSMRQLGVIYAYGIGVIPDAKEADMWLTRAEKRGVRLLPRKRLVVTAKPRSEAP